jgi:hypothetical protein
VIVDDFNVFGIATPPIKTNSVLIVDPNAMLPLPISAKTLKPVPGRRREFLKIADPVQLIQFPARHGPQIARAYFPRRPRIGPVKHVLSSRIPERPYHGQYYTL